MSTFSNPFAQLGDYRNQLNNNDDDLVTTSYLTGLPDPSHFANQQFAFVFRMLLKRDERTKLRGLAELHQLFVHDATTVDEQVHLAYIQLYAKFSLDVSPLVRAESHNVLASLYKNLGKKSTKYLKYSCGPLLTGKYDPDSRGASAAENALNAIFPGKQSMLVTRMKPDLLQYIYDAFTNTNILTLSDERYVTKEDSVQKYMRLLKTCLDLLCEFSTELFDQNSYEISELLESGKLFKFFGSQSYMLSSSALKLARQQLPNLEPYVNDMWTHLLKAARTYSGAGDGDITVIQMMNLLTKQYPNVWNQGYNDSINSLAQFIQSAMHGVRFWPLLYNLAMIIPKKLQNFTGLISPLRKTVLRLPSNTELEDSCWGCFVMICVKTGNCDDKVIETALSRCKNPRAPVKVISKYLCRLENVDIDEISTILPKSPFQFQLVVAGMHNNAFKPLISALTSHYDLQQLRMLLEIDASIELQQPISDDPLWIGIACLQPSLADEVVHKFVFTHPLLVLQHAKKLRVIDIGLLDNYVLNQTENVSVAEAAVSAMGLLVSAEIGKTCFSQLVMLALESSEVRRTVQKLVNANSSLYALIDDDELRMGLQGLDVNKQVSIADFDLNKYEWTVSSFACTNALCLVPPAANDKLVPDPLQFMEYLTDSSYKLVIIHEFLEIWKPVAPVSMKLDFQKFEQKYNSVIKVTVEMLDQLFELMNESRNEYILFFAALAIHRYATAEFKINKRFDFSKAKTEPEIQAVLFNFGCKEEDQMQIKFARQISLNCLPKHEWKFVDPEFAPSANVNLDDFEAECFAIVKLQAKLDLQQRAFDSSSKEVEYTAFKYLRAASIPELLSFCESFNVNSIGDAEIAHKCLELAKGSECEVEPEWITSLVRNSCLDLQFIALRYYNGAELDLSLDIEDFPINSLILLQQDEVSEQLLANVLKYIVQHLSTNGPHADVNCDAASPALAARLMLSCLCNLQQQVVRDFYRDCRDRQFLKTMDYVLATDVTPKLLKQVKHEILECQQIQSNETTEVSVNEKLREIRISREIEDEFTVEMVLALPEQYPAKPVCIDLKNLRGVSEAKKRGWILEARQKAQIGILQAILGLVARLDNFLNGVEPCAICYSLVDTNNKLPNKTCAQCHNVYHADCLYKWFSTNKDKLCPMCRAPM